MRLDQERWVSVLEAPGLIAFHNDCHSGACRAVSLAENRGVVLGTLFARGAVVSTSRFTARESEAIAGSAGERLIQKHWGRYVAVVRTRDGVRVLRDPSGGIPCYFVACRGVTLFFSDAESMLRIEPMTLSINWDFVAALSWYSMLQVPQTGLLELSEALAGECIERVGDDIRRISCWDPGAIAVSDPIENPDEAVEALRHVTRTCVHAWASCHSSILHRLSGGLDSSIVLSCLSDAPSKPLIRCVNYYSDDPEEDERRYARLSAGLAGCELIERRRNLEALRLGDILSVARSPRPWFYLYSVEHSAGEAGLAHESGATAFFGGLVGDAVFYQARGDLAARDFVERHGVGPALFRVALDAAVVEQRSIWSVLRQAIVSGVFRPEFDPIAEAGRSRRLLSTESVLTQRRAADLARQVVSHTRELPAGKIWHLFSMTVTPPFYDPLGRENDPENVHPLTSQPLVELCLRIPTYVLMHGGWDRSIARKAFSRDVPREITRRRGKGGSNLHTRRIFDRHIDFLRDVLLDGALVKQRILDRRRLEECLEPGRSIVDGAFAEILLQHLSTESWVRRWSAAAVVTNGRRSS